MRVLVLSVLSSVLEDELSRHAQATGGPMPLVCMPATAASVRRRTTPRHPYELVTIPSLQDFKALRQLAASLEDTIGAVATTNECALQAAAFLRAHLGLPGMDLATAVGFTDKDTMKRRLRAAGVPVAAHQVAYHPTDVLNAAADLGGWPVVVKHRLGFNSVNTHIVRSPQNLWRVRADGVFTASLDVPQALAGEVAHTGLATSPMGFMVEQYVPVHHEYHCEILKAAGSVVYAITGRYSRPCLAENEAGLAGGVLLHPHSIEAKQVRTLALAAADALGMPDGCAHAEVFETEDGQWILGEIAARPGGLGIQPAIRHAYTGIDLPAILAALARNEPPVVFPVRKQGVYGWAAALSQPAVLQHIADRDQLVADPRILDAQILQQPGTVGEPGFMPVAYLFLRTPSPAQMDEAISGAANLLEVSWASQRQYAAAA